MANAGLIEGSFEGIAGGGSVYHAIPGTNAPSSKISSTTWFIRDLGTLSSNAQWFDMDDYGNHFMYGGVTNSVPQTAILTPDEAWGIDTKVDDGLPGTGKMMTFNPSGWNNAGGTLERCTLATSSAAADADYDLNVSSAQCTLIFRDIF